MVYYILAHFPFFVNTKTADILSVGFLLRFLQIQQHNTSNIKSATPFRRWPLPLPLPNRNRYEFGIRYSCGKPETNGSNGNATIESKKEGIKTKLYRTLCWCGIVVSVHLGDGDQKSPCLFSWCCLRLSFCINGFRKSS